MCQNKNRLRSFQNSQITSCCTWSVVVWQRFVFIKLWKYWSCSAKISSTPRKICWNICRRRCLGCNLKKPWVLCTYVTLRIQDLLSIKRETSSLNKLTSGKCEHKTQLQLESPVLKPISLQPKKTSYFQLAGGRHWLEPTYLQHSLRWTRNDRNRNQAVIN